MKRGQIWWAEIKAPAGSGPGYKRPVLIVQSDAFNASKIATVVVVSITSNLRLAAAPGNILLRKSQSSLYKDSVINVSQVLTLDKQFLTEQAGQLPTQLMHQVDNGLLIALDIR